MKLFNAHIDGIELDTLIIARSGSHAAEIFITYWTATHPDAFSIFQSTVPKLFFLEDLQQLVTGRTSGIIHFEEDEGFRLEPM